METKLSMCGRILIEVTCQNIEQWCMNSKLALFVVLFVRRASISFYPELIWTWYQLFREFVIAVNLFLTFLSSKLERLIASKPAWAEPSFNWLQQKVIMKGRLRDLWINHSFLSKYINSVDNIFGAAYSFHHPKRLTVFGELDTWIGTNGSSELTRQTQCLGNFVYKKKAPYKKKNLRRKRKTPYKK